MWQRSLNFLKIQKRPAWGTEATRWTKTRSAVQGQEEGALEALHDGEEHGLGEYQEALEDDSVGPQLKKTIRERLIPNQKSHMKKLNQMI